MANIEHPDSVDIDTTIDRFIERISSFSSICYFHNLKFDGTFITYWLLINGYLVARSSGSRKVEPGMFKMLMSDMGSMYSITVTWRSGHTTEFRDSYKKLMMNVENVAKTFDTDMLKDEIDYHEDRPVGHVITEHEAKYIHNDVGIIAHAMAEIHGQGMDRLTIGSDSLHEYKQLMGGNDAFRTIFPLFGAALDGEIRRAYRGGFTYADPRRLQKMQGSGIVLDVNSLYPSVMVKELIPYGEPTFSYGKPEPTTDRPLVIFTVTFTAKLKSKHIPCIQVKGSSVFSATEYLSKIHEPTTLTVTNIDWDLYNDHYDIDVIEYCGGWSFKASHGLFDDYVSKWGQIKASSEGGMYAIAKLHLNSLYGKMATNPVVQGKIPVLIDDRVKYKRDEEETREPVYTAAGVFITSWARDLTIRAAQENYDTFAYADTDSLHLLRKDVPSNIEVHPDNMGAWDHEYSFDQAFYLRAKAYMELKDDGEYVNRFAGLPVRVSETLTFDDLVDGKVLHGKLTPRNVPGGVVLEDVDYKLIF